MEYLLLIASAMLLALNFSINKIYQIEKGASFESGIKFNLVLSFYSAVMFFIANALNFEITFFSFVMAFGLTVSTVSYTILGFIIMKTGQMAMYTLFLMSGGMVLPYIWGIVFLNEEVSFFRILGLVLIVGSIILSNANIKKVSLKTLLLCFLVFVLNGMNSIFSKMHQINDESISTFGFLTLSSVVKFFLTFIVYLILRFYMGNKKSFNESESKSPKKVLLVILASALVSGLSSFLNLNGAKNIDASVLYPIITGGTIFFSAVAGWLFFKEKPDKKMIASIIICFLGTCLFL